MGLFNRPKKIIALVFVLAYLTSCQSNTAEWKPVLQPLATLFFAEKDFFFVQAASRNGDVWASNVWADSVTHISDTTAFIPTSKKIKLPAEEAVFDLCVSSQGIFVSSASGNILKYQTEDDQWSYVITTDEAGGESETFRCRDLADGSVDFFSLQHLVSYRAGSVSHVDLPDNTKDIAQDASGNLWVLSDAGELYQRQQDEQWVLRYDFAGRGLGLFAEVNSDVLWIVNQAGVYRWPADNSAATPDTLLSATDEVYSEFVKSVFIVNAYQSDHHGIWLVPDRGKFVLQFQQEIFHKVTLPNSAGNIWHGSDFDPENQVLYVAAANGIYFFNLSGK